MVTRIQKLKMRPLSIFLLAIIAVSFTGLTGVAHAAEGDASSGSGDGSKLIRVVNGKQQEFLVHIDRLIKDEPFQYIAGTTEFYGLELKCDSRALIPRPETEELVQWMIDSIPCESVLRIGDICSGSGCIGLALKSKLKMCIIDSYELSDEALSLIADNIKHTGLNLNVEKFDALSTDFSSIQKNYSALVSNPPYIPFKDGSDMHENVLAHEPHMALFVEDDDPLVFYDNICLNGKAVLIDGGWIYFEIHEDLAAQVKSIFEGNGFVNIEVRKDLQGKERMVRGQKLPSHHEQE